MIRLLVVDDHPVVRAGIRAVLGGETTVQVAAEAENGTEAISQYMASKPDVVCMDLRMPVMDGITAIKAIRRRDAQARILVLSHFACEVDIASALEAGAKGYLMKGAPRAELLSAVKRVHQGQLVLPKDLADRLAERMTFTPLTDRETEVLRLMAQGLSNTEIAERAGVGVSTVKSHANSLFSKLSVQDRTQAVLLAIRRGLVKLA